MQNCFIKFLLLLFVCLLLSINTSNAQVLIDANFSGTGARALSLGTSFIALADDATASDFNPAGLLILERREVAMQLKYTWDDHREYLPLSSLQNIDDFEMFSDEYFTPSYLSFVLPRERFAFSVSSFTNVNFEHCFDDQGFERDVEMQLNNYAASIAFLAHPKLYLGATVKLARFRYDIDDEIFFNDHLDAKDTSAGYNIGLLWRLHPDWTIGAVYKSELPLSFDFAGVDVDLEIPSTLGAGVAFHPNDRLRILADVDHISWSEFEDVNNFKRDDVTRLHAGVEYLLGFVGDTAFFVRGGYMLEPSNDRYYTGPYDDVKELYPQPDDIHHYTAGVGMARPSYQLDAAIDYTDDLVDVIVSFVYYF
jgi:long-chain fatty acid transport protein